MRPARLAPLLSATAALYLWRVRGPVLTWGATEEEASSRLPGDELLEDADGGATRAIEIKAPASAVWPWLVQIGPSPRGGAYTYDWIENLLGLNMHSTDRVLPEFQHPEVGDAIGYGTNRMRLEIIDHERALAWRSEDGNWVWSFILREENGVTRLISRNRFRLPTLVARLGMLLMEPASLLMERKMLLGIKDRAERLAVTPQAPRSPRGLLRARVASCVLVALSALALTAPAASLAVGHPHPSAAASFSHRSWPTMRLGSRGPAVLELQRRLAWATYLPWGSAIDGVFGMRTWHAVVAFQGWNGLSRDGVVGPATRSALAHASRPRAWSGTTGFEIHLARQVVLLVRDRRVVRAIHVSTGRPGYSTPLGSFHVYLRDPMSWSNTFHTWMPLAQYFYGGYALHEYADVPAYPASHGCVRVPEQESRTVWDFGYVGARVRVLAT